MSRLQAPAFTAASHRAPTTGASRQRPFTALGCRAQHGLIAQPAPKPAGSSVGAPWPRGGATLGGGRPARPGAPRRGHAPRSFLDGGSADVLFEATGVPLLDELMRMRTIDAAVSHSLELMGVTVVAAVVVYVLLDVVDRMAGNRIARSGRDFNLPMALLASAFRPAKVLLPYYAVTYITTVGSALAQTAALRLEKEFASLCHGRSDEVLNVLKLFTQLVQDTSELLIIIFVAWAAIDFKNRALRWLAATILSDSNTTTDAALTLLRPLSGVFTFLILLAASGFTLGAYGLNLGPVVASLGGIGVIVGLATQGLVTNVVSAIALFTARPFVVGDEVHLYSGAALVVRGVVAQMEPMRTIVRSDDGGLVYLNNSEVTNYVIKNMTQGRSLEAVGTGRLEASISDVGGTQSQLLV